MPMQFIDNSIKIQGAINDATKAWLIEAANEVKSHAQRNCKMIEEGSEIGKQLKGSYKTDIREVDSGKAYVGTDMEAGYWEEFGTGSFAENGKGRRGWWVYVKDGTEHAPNGGITYASREEAEGVAAGMRAQGMDAYATNGREPNHTLQNAFIQTTPKAEARLAQIIQEGVGE